MRPPALPPSRRTHRAAAGAVLLGLALVLVPAGAAQAHVELVASDPAEGAVLPVPPSQVRLEMSGEVTFGSAVATDGCGRQVQGEVTVDGHLVDAVLPDTPAAPGAWAVAYELVAADGHLVAGEVRFTVAGDAGCEPVAEGATEPAPVDAADLAVGTDRLEPTSTTSSTTPAGVAPGPAAAVLVVAVSGAAVTLHRWHARRRRAGEGG